jgi:hypothetical protein
MHDFVNEFENAARNALSFLVADRGFAEDSVTLPNDANSVYATYAITYARRECTSLPLFVRLSDTPARGELYLECIAGTLHNRDRTCDVRELMAIAMPGSALKFDTAVSHAIGHPGLMREQFKTLANALKNHGDRFFDQDGTLWDDVRAVRENCLRQYECDALNRAAQRSMRESELAFKAKDWQRVVSLLGSLGAGLTKAQSARLSYARKQLSEKGEPSRAPEDALRGSTDGKSIVRPG